MFEKTWIAVLVFFAAACNSSETQIESRKDNDMTYTNDPHSFAKPNEAVVEHLNLDLTVDFENNQLIGTAEWQISSNHADEIIFDIRQMEIEKAWADGEETEFSLGEEARWLGRPLTVKIGENTKTVTIKYRTHPEAAALQWLSPQQTYDKKAPFLFTQSQAILARTWVPCQDSPGIRFTYNAKVKVPKGMLALMSAENPQEKNPEGEYSFVMDIPIPSYLLALSVGDVAFAPVGSRTGVYAEPGLLEASVHEFADMETMVDSAEALYGEYPWGRYDLIVLPPSFPFGGMENPKLTFATPTIIAGDRSLVSLVAHELAHSWSGNTVTNATWNDFWLNEGFTVYFEHRIMEAVYGRDYSEMLALLSYNDLKVEVAEMLEDREKDTHLKLDLEGRDPDDGMNRIAYDKGYFLLRLIEETVGRKEWDAFLKNYFSENQFQSTHTEAFLERLKKQLLTPAQWEEIGVEKWVYGPGLPNNAPKPKSERFAVVEKAAQQFLDGNTLANPEVFRAWTTHEWLHFIQQLPDDIGTEKLAFLDKAFDFSQSGNSEILAAWFRPAIMNKYKPAYPKIESFLTTVGRRKFLTPTYRAMKESGQIDWAREVYAKARPNYHAVAVETMDELLKK